MTEPLHRWPGLPERSALPDGGKEVLQRWEVLLGRSPRLRPWLGELLGRHRLILEERMEGSPRAAIEQTLWNELDRWLRDFEALPQFAVTAIATTLEQVEAAPPPRPERRAAPEAPDSPERAVTNLQTLVADPAFALAFHCVEARVRPRLRAALEDAAAPEGGAALAHIPEADWFGLLHASAPAQSLLTPAVAVALVLRVLSADWSSRPAASRAAALRLFHATASDVRPTSGLDRLCASLPPAWRLLPAALPDFVKTSQIARAALADASSLCGRIVAATKGTKGTKGSRPGGLASLQDSGDAPASPDELAELSTTARTYKEMTGFRKLLALL